MLKEKPVERTPDFEVVSITRVAESNGEAANARRVESAARRLRRQRRQSIRSKSTGSGWTIGLW